MSNANPDLEWQRRYEENDTPWDKGTAAPSLLAYLEKHSMRGRILVPGCGRGHEVLALGKSPDASVVGLDISPTAITQASEHMAQSDPVAEVEFIEGDFLNLPAEMRHTFDWLVEHTCFCALDPSQRLDYVSAAGTALKPGGKVFAIFYLTPDVETGPPFAISKDELNALFDPHFKLLEEWVPQVTFPGRENRELVRLMHRR